MSADIGVGDFVEKILDGPSVPVGTVARVLALAETALCVDCGDEGPGLILSVPHGAPFVSWCTYGWRPIYRPRASFIESLKQPTPADRVPA